MASLVVYQPIIRERVVIIKEMALDYLVEDLISGKQYLIDKAYFRSNYEVAVAFEQELIQ